MLVPDRLSFPLYCSRVGKYGSSDTKGRKGRIVVVILREGKKSGTDHGEQQSERAYVSAKQYFLVRSSLKSSSNVPADARTRENTATADLGPISCLVRFIFWNPKNPAPTSESISHECLSRAGSAHISVFKKNNSPIIPPTKTTRMVLETSKIDGCRLELAWKSNLDKKY